MELHATWLVQLRHNWLSSCGWLWFEKLRHKCFDITPTHSYIRYTFSIYPYRLPPIPLLLRIDEFSINQIQLDSSVCWCCEKMNLKARVTIRREDDNWNAQFKTAQQLQRHDATESKPSSWKAKQSVLDLTYPANRTAFGKLKMLSQKCQILPWLSLFTLIHRV